MSSVVEPVARFPFAVRKRDGKVVAKAKSMRMGFQGTSSFRDPERSGQRFSKCAFKGKGNRNMDMKPMINMRCVVLFATIALYAAAAIPSSVLEKPVF